MLMKSFLRISAVLRFLFFSEGQFLFVNVVFSNHVCQPRQFAHRIELGVTCHSAVQPALLFRTYIFPSFPVARAWLVLVSYIALCLAFTGLRNAKTITPVMQAKGNPCEKMANFFRERLCILF